MRKSLFLLMIFLTFKSFGHRVGLGLSKSESGQDVISLSGTYVSPSFDSLDVTLDRVSVPEEDIKLNELSLSYRSSFLPRWSHSASFFHTLWPDLYRQMLIKYLLGRNFQSSTVQVGVGVQPLFFVAGDATAALYSPMLEFSYSHFWESWAIDMIVQRFFHSSDLQVYADLETLDDNVFLLLGGLDRRYLAFRMSWFHDNWSVFASLSSSLSELDDSVVRTGSLGLSFLWFRQDFSLELGRSVSDELGTDISLLNFLYGYSF